MTGRLRQRLGVRTARRGGTVHTRQCSEPDEVVVLLMLKAFAPVLLLYALTLIAILMLGATEGSSGLRAGVACVDITPPVHKRSIPLHGYFQRQKKPAQGVHDALYAKSIVLANGGEKVAIVQTDLSNIKITQPADVAIAEAILKSRPKPKPKGPTGPYSEAQW